MSVVDVIVCQAESISNVSIGAIWTSLELRPQPSHINHRKHCEQMCPPVIIGYSPFFFSFYHTVTVYAALWKTVMQPAVNYSVWRGNVCNMKSIWMFQKPPPSFRYKKKKRRKSCNKLPWKIVTIFFSLPPGEGCEAWLGYCLLHVAPFSSLLYSSLLFQRLKLKQSIKIPAFNNWGRDCRVLLLRPPWCEESLKDAWMPPQREMEGLRGAEPLYT